MTATLLRCFTIALTCATLAACSSGAGQRGPDGQGVPAGLDGVLARIRAEEARLAEGGAKSPAALPQEKLGDQAWLAGPEGTFSVNSNNHTLTISSGSLSVGNINYLSYAVFRYTGNTGETPRYFFLEMAPDPSAQYSVYVVTYGAIPVWDQLGSFVGEPGNNGIPLELPGNTVSPNGNVYVAVVVADQFTVTLTNSRVSETFEHENNDGTGQANQIPLIAGSSGFDITGQIGSGDPEGDTDGDNADWFYIDAPSGGLVLFTLSYTNSTGQVDSYLYGSDGTTELDSGNVDYADEYIVENLPAAGPYYLKLACTSGYASYVVRAWFDGGVYGETEDNDNHSSGNPLIGSTTFEPLSGEIGPAGTNDGDTEDWFFFSGSSQSLLQLKLYADDKSAVPQIDLYAADGTSLLVTGQEENEYFVLERPVNPVTFKVKVSSATDTTAYVLGGFQASRNSLGTGYDESEENDVNLAGDLLPAFPFSDWKGSLGVNPGGGSYDGDRIDWAKFDAANGQTLDLNLSQDFDHADLSIFLYDGANTLLASSETQGGSENINYAFTADATYFLKIECLYGYSDYTVDATLTP